MAMEPLPLGCGDLSMDACSSLWPLQDHYHPQECVEEVTRRLAAATVELEAAREEVRRKEQSIARLVELVRRTAKERDELRQLLLLLAREREREREQLVVTTTSSGDDSDKQNLASSSPVAAVDRLELLAAATKRPLPQQGRLLQAVMEAGPLLHNLMVAGPLPRWRNPPPTQALPSPSPVISSPPSYPCAPMGNLPRSID